MKKIKVPIIKQDTSATDDYKNVLALGLYTPSQSIATGNLRNDSMQNIIGILAHTQWPASKEDLMRCAVERRAEKEVIECIKKLPSQDYQDLSFVISAVIKQKLDSTIFPKD